MFSKKTICTAMLLALLALCGCSSDKSNTIDKMFTERDYDSSYAKSSPHIELSDAGIKCTDDGVGIDGNTATIKAKGTYIVSGSSDDARIMVDVAKTDKVQIVLDNASINSSRGCPIYVRQADKVFLTMSKDSSNTLSNSGDYEVIDESNIDGVIFARDDITINGDGKLKINANYGHAVVCKDDLKLTEGEVNINAAGDGLQGKSSVRIGGGSINVEQSAEGIEGAVIYVCAGNTTVKASDDGINASSDAVSSENVNAVDDNCSIEIKGGKLKIDAQGDGIDSNGSLAVSGGEIYVEGPTSGADSAIDCAGRASITGGTVIALGSAGMAENFTEADGQASMLISISGAAGDTITVTDSEGTELLSYKSGKAFQTAVISSPDIKDGGSYTVTTSSGGSASVKIEGALYSAAGGPGGAGLGDSGAMGKDRPDAAPEIPSGGPREPGGGGPGGGSAPPDEKR